MDTLKPGWTKQRVMEQIKKYNNGKAARTFRGGVCSYKTGSGNRCAIGCFIPDDHPGLRSTDNVVGLLVAYPDLAENMPFSDLEALLRFQEVHDESDDVYDAIEKFLQSQCEEARSL